MTPSPVLRAVNLRRSFHTAEATAETTAETTADATVEVLKGVGLELFRGDVVAILGPSGSGKSTLLHLLGGLDRPSAGEIYWGEVAVHKAPQRALSALRGERVGLVFQQHYLLSDLSVLDNVMLPGRIGGAPDKARAEELVERVGLAGRAGFLPHKLSGGERQRVAVARARSTRGPPSSWRTSPPARWTATTRRRCMSSWSRWLEKRRARS